MTKHDKRVCLSRVCSRQKIVWARVSGHRPWPARILDDERALEFRKPTDDTLVRFFGSGDLAWLKRDRAIVPWKIGVQKRHHRAARRCKGLGRAIKAVLAHCTEKSGVTFEEVENSEKPVSKVMTCGGGNEEM